MTTYKETLNTNPSHDKENPVATMEMTTPEETAIPSLTGIFGRQNSGNPAPYVSFRPSTQPEKARLYRAMTNPDYRIADCINQIIRLADVFVEWVEMLDQSTGEIATVPRCVLFDVDGKTYAATSRGIANSLERLAMVYGMPHWDTPIPVKIRQVQAKERRFYTLDIAE